MLDFLGIGAQKAGTTWLAEMLALHPQIAFPAGKEVHFWDNPSVRDNIEDYRALFPEQPGRKMGEITPAYAILPLEIIAQIYEYFPNVKLLYAVRDPIERAWSSALMFMKRADLRLEEASDQWFLDLFRSQGSMKRGDYEYCITQWLRLYPETQLMVIRNEEIAEMPRKVMMSLCEHLEIDPAFFQELADSTLNARVFTGENHALRPSLRAALEEIYAEKYRRFNEFLDALNVKRAK